MNAVTIEGSSPTIYSTSYSQFKGVDFSTDPMLVDKSRSPYAVNLISDSGGMPEKRTGWRVLHTLGGVVNGLWHCHIGDSDHLIAHVGTNLYEWQEIGDPVLLKEGVNDGKSTAFFLLSKLYILTGAEYLQYDGTAITDVEPYVPTVVVNRKPSGGGDYIEALNLIGKQWNEEFIGDGSTKDYQLSYTGLDDTPVICKVYENGAWVDKVENTDFTVDRTLGKVTFTTAPANATVPNVKITPSKTREGSTDKIKKSKSAVVYNDSVVFVCGAERGIDYRSGYGKPGYFPDTGYDRVGTDATDIMGYCKIGEYLGIVKESNSQDSTIFLRWHDQQTTYDADGKSTTETVYKKKQGVVGVGAVSRNAIGMLLDEPLFLSSQGIFALTSNAVTFERTVQNRSEYLDFNLTREEGLEKAVCCEWQGYFILCVNGHCYVLDSKQRTAKSRNNSNFVYEGYYWENIPASTFLSVGGSLYFGTEDGRICKFNTDMDGMARYNDDGQAITAVWSTQMDDDGHPQRLKTMVKKGCAVTLKPFTRSGVAVYVRTEKDAAEREIRSSTLDIFDWEDIDFSRFSFDSNDSARDVMLRKKEKKYKRLQFFVKNTALNEGFGVYQITKHYKVLGLAKK